MGNFDLESGKRFMHEGDLVEAIRCFLSSIDQDPAEPEAYAELFNAYAQAWQESGDPLVLDQMRKVAIAGLKRQPAPDQRKLLEDGLDTTEETLAAIQRDEEELLGLGKQKEQKEQKDQPRRLPMIKDGTGRP